MFVSAYTSRPALHIKQGGEGSDQRPFIVTFADAVEKFGDRIEQGGLDAAYRRAGRAFVGQLEQHFVVLKNEPLGAQVRDAPVVLGKGKKRPLEDQEMAYGRSTEVGRGRARGNRGSWRAKSARR